MADSHKQIVDNLHDRQRQLISCMCLWGSDEASKKQIAMSVCERANLRLYELPGNLVPAKPDECEAFCRLWMRESVLLGSTPMFLLMVLKSQPFRVESRDL